MFSQSASNRATLPVQTPVSNWSVALYRKAEPAVTLNSSDIPGAAPVSPAIIGSFYVQLQYQASSDSPSSSDVLYFRYQSQHQRNTADVYTLPFTVSQISDFKLAPDVVQLASTRTNNADPATGMNVTFDAVL